jgi:methanogenic corrinoid protein MtbC1
MLVYFVLYYLFAYCLTLGEIKNVVDIIKASDVADKVKIMIGGAPVTQVFCDNIGADRYAPDAATAAEAAAEYFV